MPSILLKWKVFALFIFVATSFADFHQIPHKSQDVFAGHHHHHDDEDAHHHHGDDKDGHTHHHHGDWCGTKHLSQQEKQMQQLRIEAFRHHTSSEGGENRRLLPQKCQELCDQCIEIQVRLNLLILETDDHGPRAPHPTELMHQLQKSDWSNVQWDKFSTPEDVAVLFEDNMEILNSAFSGTPFRFAWDGQYNLGSGEAVFGAFDDRAEVSAEMGSDDLRILDVFVAYQLIHRRGSGLMLGFATPASLQEKGRGDGVYLRYDVLTGGGMDYAGLDLGYVLVHEVGHWLGLLHTFETLSVEHSEYDCSPEEIALGDFVSDTGPQKGASYNLKCRSYLNGKRPPPDTCPDLPGNDPLFNYMNYLDDDYCLAREGEFTCGQKERMFSQWSLFRDRVTSCSNPDEFEVELVVAFDSTRLHQTHRVILRTGDELENGDIIYDSIADQVYMIPLLSGMTLVDHCLPRSQRYSVVVSDSDGIGFEADGKVEIYVERELVGIVEGSFGKEFTMTIGGPFDLMEESDYSVDSPGAVYSTLPSASPSYYSATPSTEPSNRPSTPSPTASSIPTDSAGPSLLPSFSMAPTVAPSGEPSSAPSTSQSPSSSLRPSSAPTASPTKSNMPSNAPSPAPSPSPTLFPTSKLTSPVPSQLTVERSNEASSSFFFAAYWGALLTTMTSVLLLW